MHPEQHEKKADIHRSNRRPLVWQTRSITTSMPRHGLMMVNVDFSVLQNNDVKNFWRGMLETERRDANLNQYTEITFNNQTQEQNANPPLPVKRKSIEKVISPIVGIEIDTFEETDSIHVDGMEETIATWIGRDGRITAVTDRKSRYFNALGMNGILDLSDTSEGSQFSKFSVDTQKKIRQLFSLPHITTPCIKQRFEEIQNELCHTANENGRYSKRYLEKLGMFKSKEKYISKGKLYFNISYIFDPKDSKFLPEGDYVVKVWGPSLKTLFRGSGSVLHWGDTVPDNVKAVGRTIKMDLRIINSLGDEKGFWKSSNSARSKACLNYKPSKAEELQALLGDNATSCTRKIKLETIIREQYKQAMLSKIQTVSEQVRNIMIRAQLFVNYYIISHSNSAVDKKVFTQNFWYAITQLVLQRAPNQKSLPSDCLESWTSFSSRFNVTYTMVPKVEGYSHCVSAACVTTATTYNNNIVECFEARLKAYILYNIKKKFEEPDSTILRKIVHQYCYQHICGGSPEWPEDIPELYNEKKQEIDEICQELIIIDIPRPVTLQSLAASPGSYIPMLATLLQKNEQENIRIATNRLDETPPRLFPLSPIPSTKWRFIDVNANALAAFSR
ncbi:hypothetical protein [Parasitella parasitica]|uniref:Uncharacterized protein n=2 Tax=Parasitella parasitica TaxID=35722 RepID=A0A0B7NQZ4_9FUNG|nr:hypothetical protein [Parasitella parasitica]